jgi:hypothetical protein
VIQQHLLKKREELVEKAQTEVEEINSDLTGVKTNNIELEHEISGLLTKIKRMKDQEKILNNKVLEERTKHDKIIKTNLLVDELNKEMLEMNIEDLCKFVNHSLYECVHDIRRSNIKEIIKTGDKVLDMLKEQKLTDVADAIETIMKQFEFLRDKKDKVETDTKKGNI